MKRHLPLRPGRIAPPEDAALGVIVGDLASVFLWFLIFALTGTTGKSLTHDAATW